jgi:hypothetical protein
MPRVVWGVVLHVEALNGWGLAHSVLDVVPFSYCTRECLDAPLAVKLVE